MTYNINIIILLPVIGILASCAGINKQDYYYDEIFIKNKSTKNVTDVKIKVRETGLLFTCSFIPPRGECSNKFKKRKYLGNPVLLSWVFNDGKKKTKKLKLKLPIDAKSERPLKGMLEIDGNGLVNPYLF